MDVRGVPLVYQALGLMFGSKGMLCTVLKA